jgi:hypothetical protein
MAYTMLLHVCARPAIDAGRACSDSRECQGICELPESAYSRPAATADIAPVPPSTRVRLIPKPGTSIVGECSALWSEIKAPNCTAYVANGKVALAGCAD